jgi:hypothetical protein
MPRAPVITITDNTFQLDNKPFDTADVRLTFPDPQQNLIVTVYDKTYDPTINFATLVTSEENILNVDYEIENYNKFKSTEIELGSRFGSWEFNKDSFGNAVTVVKTEKLSGKEGNTTIINYASDKKLSEF